MSMAMENTFVMVKPDGVQRGLVGEIVARFERKGLTLKAMKMITIQKALAEQHYGEHKGKGFYDSLISYITSGPVVAMVWEGDNAVEVARTMMGATDPAKSAPGTIRGDFGMFTGRNVIHGSDSPESARREINLFFNDYELQAYEKIGQEWLYE